MHTQVHLLRSIVINYPEEKIRRMFDATFVPNPIWLTKMNIIIEREREREREGR